MFEKWRNRKNLQRQGMFGVCKCGEKHVLATTSQAIYCYCGRVYEGEKFVRKDQPMLCEEG